MLGDERVNVVVILKDQPDSPSTGEESANVSEQNDLLSRWSETYDLTVERQFGYLVNGFSASMPSNRMLALSQEPEVASVKIERLYQPMTDEEREAATQATANALAAATNLPAEHAARDAQGVPAALAQYGTDGTGTVISIIDSGIDPGHRDLRLDAAGAAGAKIQSVNSAAGTSEAGFTLKVPNGYNYADENYVIKDTTSSQHGQHVAGIVGANGSEEGESAADAWAKGRIDGVAPNAQLLAMKVFSNNGGGARDADIIAAIEDSVKLGADALNLSLGSDNGLNDASDGTYRALAKARQAGVIANVAAANEGLNFDPAGTTKDPVGYFDDATLGSPASFTDAFTVASIDNTTVTNPQAIGTIDGVQSPTLYSLQTGEADNQDHQLVDVGLGREQDYAPGQDLAGAYALIERGEITFTDKFQKAIDHGAAGVVVFNSAAGGEELVGMGGLEAFTIPGGSIPRSAGLALRQGLTDGKNVTIRFSTQTATSPNATALTPSDFTSWGTTPTLDFKPEVAGIGGSVYSTLNDDKYGTKSGTSMATPNVSGMVALLVQNYSQRYPNMSAAERADLIRLALMNTARIPVSQAGVPYAPRQIGAGLAQVDKALATSVTAEVTAINGSAVEGKGEGSAVGGAALREVNGPVSFTVTLSNRGSSAVEYEVPAQQVVTESNTAGEATTTSITGESLTASAQRVSVPAGGSTRVTFTLTPDTSSTHYIEGWARLSSLTGDAPDLAVPYLGFVGDWDAEQIVASPGTGLPDGLDPTKSITQLVTSYRGRTVPVSSARLGTFALSPNRDKDMDTIAPHMMMLRNASDVEYEILDSSGAVVRVLGAQQSVRRTKVAALQTATSNRAHTATSASFTGKVWSAADNAWKVLPDGQYTYRVKTRVRAEGEWQNTDMSFTIDTVAPVITVTASTATSVTFTVTEEGSGLFGAPEATTPDGTELDVTDNGDGTYTATLPAGTNAEYVNISAVDRGLTLGTLTHVLQGSAPLILTEAASIEGQLLGASSSVVNRSGLRVNAVVSSEVARVSMAGTDVTPDNGRISVRVPLSEGAQSVEVIAYAADGSELARQTLSFTYDATPPTLDVNGLGADSSVTLEADGSVTITGRVSDERAGAELAVSVDGIPATVNPDGTFTVTVWPDEDQINIPVVASDGVNTTTRTLPIAGREAKSEDNFRAPTFQGCSSTSMSCFVDSTFAGVNAESVTLTGAAGSAKSITFTPASYVDDNGVMVTPDPIQATIKEDGTFTITLPLAPGQKPGISQFRYVVTDQEGEVAIDRAFLLYYDVKAPSLSFTEPTLYGGVLYTAQPEVTFAGCALDDGWGYRLRLNGSVVLDVFNDSGLGAPSNEREFSTALPVAHGDTLMVDAKDSMDNDLIGGIRVIVDQQAPQASISEISEGETVSDDRTVTVSAQDENLASATVTLNGTVVSTLTTKASAAAGPVQDILVPGSETTAATPMDSEKELRTDVDLSTLPAGLHTLMVNARDLAGNEIVRSLSFRVDRPAQITGPEELTRQVSAAQLSDQEALAALVLASYTVSDDGAVLADGTVAPGEQTTLALAPGTLLREGRQEVTLVATDAAGRSVTRTVTVTLIKAAVTPGDNNGGDNSGGNGSDNGTVDPGKKPGPNPDELPDLTPDQPDNAGNAGGNTDGERPIAQRPDGRTGGSARLARTGAEPGLMLAASAMLMTGVAAVATRRTRQRNA